MSNTASNTATDLAFSDLEAHRVELTGYCYRMLGSGFEVEDAVQETLLRAWRTGHDAERGPLRPWLYRIATNRCVDMLRSAQRRARAMVLGPAAEPGPSLGEPLPPSAWVQPVLTATGAGQWQASEDDRVVIDRARSEHTVRTDRAELFLLRLYLHNTGSVPWRDRLLYRVGVPVTTGTPFTPGVLPVPDTDPGQQCEVLVPGRAQWFRSHAAINFVMVFPDFTPCLPGRVTCWIDTGGAELDSSQPLLPGFPGADREVSS
jgi:RNA polymerase sigma factor (sigma-70 family)